MANPLHHLHIARRLRGAKKRSLFDTLMVGVGLAAPLALLPQVNTLFTTHQTAGLSMDTWLLLCAINIMWTIYSVIHRELPLFMMSAALVIIDAIIVLGIVLYS